MKPLRELAAMSAEREVNLGARNFLHVARYVARNQGNWDLAAKDAQQNRALPHIVEALKTATTPGTTTGWGQPLAPYAQLQSSFLAALRSASAFENMLPFLRTVPVGLHNGVVVTSGAAGTTVNEGEVKPITKMAFQTIQMTPKKTTAIAVSTKELLQFGGSDIFAQDLTNSVAAAVDASFVSEITSGISPTTSAGGGSGAILVDLAAALASLTIGANSKVFLLVSSDIAKLWSVKQTAQGELLFPSMTPTGGEVQGMSVIVTSAVSAQIVAADATQIFAASGNILLDVSTDAVVQFETSPDSPTTSSTNLVSLFQNGYAGVRATRFWSVGRARTGAVAVIDSVSYSGNSPA